ncbi:hypothetical protein ACMU_18955 [Actibacterium mucosum KCTC 23349]|uniref:Thioredoxin domain-containing protein n=1 Tax=Actibacterium mucosum KCTC 23349 TaxID=1454373 RepID=A0A037ZFC1_9RHOB|nr:DsbA family protein [Actibacterium mucosum]KAJ54303.1 hypothetical protein ACMU_18955 [Actibacterium mucosum KCTC 23349]
MRTLVTPLICALWAATAHAHEPDLDARVRAYILDNPEVILEALEILSARRAEAELKERLEPHQPMFDAPPVLGMGRADAPIRVVEFFDYRCAPCKAMHPMLETLVAEHPELRIEMRQLPILTPGSERGARFALAVQSVAGDAAYARVHDALWHLRGPLNTPSFARIAQDEGLDFSKIQTAMDSEDVTARIGYNRDFAVEMQVLGTPAFVTPSSVTFGTATLDELKALWLSQ